MIRVALVDDHGLVRMGLTTLLSAADDIDVVGEADDGDGVVAMATECQPDVILMDLSMPRVNGVDATKAVLGAHPRVKVVVLTSFADRDRVQAALSAGAIGYVLKDCAPEELLAAVRSAANGHVPIDPRVAGALLPRGDGITLSPREQEVLRLVSQGLANKQIARALGITERTVKAHLGRVFREIGVPDRTSAALWAREHLD